MWQVWFLATIVAFFLLRRHGNQDSVGIILYNVSKFARCISGMAFGSDAILSIIMLVAVPGSFHVLCRTSELV